MKRYNLLFSLICFISFFQVKTNAQCTSDAGTFTYPDTALCEITITVEQPIDAVLDSNDVIWYAQFHTKNDPLNSLISLHRGAVANPRSFALNPTFDTIYLAVFAGDSLLDGSIELDDPCLSISNISTVAVNFFDLEFETHCPGDSAPLIFNANPPITGWIAPVPGDTIFLDTDSVNLNIAPGVLGIDYDLYSADGCRAEGNEPAFTSRMRCSAMVSGTLGCSVTEVTVSVECEYGTPDYIYTVTGPDGFMTTDQTFSVSVPGVYQIEAFDAMGCMTTDLFTVHLNDTCGFIIGNVLDDINDDCLIDAGDMPLQNIQIQATSPQDTFYTFTGSSGNYTANVTFDSYEVSVISPNFPSCSGPQQVTIDNSNITGVVDFLVENNCTSFAGSLPGDSIVTCKTEITLPLPQNYNLDSDDIFRYLISDDPADPTNSVLALRGSDPTIPLNLSTLPFGREFYIYSVVGNALPNQDIDFNDPCLSVSAPVKVTAKGFRIEVCPMLPPSFVIFSGTIPYNGWFVSPPGATDTIFFIAESKTHPVPFDVFSPFEYNITNSEGCEISGILDRSPEPCAPSFSDTLTCEKKDVQLFANCNSLFDPIGWIGPNGLNFTEPNPIIPNAGLSASGEYILVSLLPWERAFTCASLDTIIVPFNSKGCGFITGTVRLDNEGDCLPTSSDQPLSNWIVTAYGTNDTFYGTTDSAGVYSIFVEPNTYDVHVYPDNAYFENCAPPQQITIAAAGNSEQADFLIKSLYDCPLMEVNVGITRLRRCFDNNQIQVRYCNQGSETAVGASLKLVLDDLLTPDSSTTPFTNLGDTLLFNLGNIAPFECGSITITASVSCDAVLGQTLCTEAYIFPDTSCLPTPPQWSRASLTLSAECVSDSVYFSIENEGSGPMIAERRYIVIEDAAIMRVSDPFQLPSGDKEEGVVAAEGSTIRIEVPQVDFHPGRSAPSVTVEGCSTDNFSIGFVNQLPSDDADPWIDIECEDVRGSFDPNDKAAAPTGWDSEHFINQNIDLEYKIRFQNTGTDTAFRVVILDTLSSLLDITTITPGASSHEYQWEVYGEGILKFTFDNINLVDSFTNESGSHGFVKYRISQMPDLSLQSVIKNAADIYFDFNDPIYTNQTFHTVGRDFITVKTKEIFVPGADVRVFPNPTQTAATFQVRNVPFGKKTLFLYNLTGKQIRSQPFDNEQLTLNVNDLPGGIYFYEISGEGIKIATGKLIVN